MAEAGHIALLIALAAAGYAVVAVVVGSRRGSGRLAASARGAILAVSVLCTLALALLLYAFFTHDFSLRIVAEHASRDLPAVYSLSALYADKSGSVFFWGWLVSLLAAWLVFRERHNREAGINYALAVLAGLEAFFLVLVALVVNVFARLPSPPGDGYGLNPLLQNAGMLVHPPLLYLGFAGFAVAFAIVLGSLIARLPGEAWSRRVRGWAVFAWCALGVGNLVGMWWSYNELGWGGYWAWDPVENAGLMPWLLGTAFLHSIAIRRRRNSLHHWSLLLIIFTFVFTLFSPFVTHGGIESPLHGFYGSPFPPYILTAMLIVLAGSLALVYSRRRDVAGETKPVSLISREGSFLLTDIILAVLVFIIFAGTVLPGLVGALGGPGLAIDRSFFDRSCGPVMLALVLLMGVCPLLGRGWPGWRAAGRNIGFFCLAVAVVAAAVLLAGIGNWYIAAAVFCGLPLFVILREWYRGTRARCRRGKNGASAFLSLVGSNRARYGGFLAHIGIVFITLGIIVSSFYSLEETVTLEPGDAASIGAYQLTYREMLLKQDNAKASAVAAVAVSRHGRDLGVMHSSYDYWFSHQDSYSEVAVRTTPAEDLFVSLVWTTFDPADKTATFRILVNPLILWIWAGGLFFILGGAVSLSAGGNEAGDA